MFMRGRFVNLILLLGCLVAVSGLLSIAAWVEANPLSTHVRSVEAQTQHSVIDYFDLLPSLGIGYPATWQEKRRLLQPGSHPVIDVRHDYLLVHPDSSPAEQVAVFRTHGKADLLAVSLPDFESDYNNFTLFRLRNGRLRDVTRQMLPMPAQTDRFLYEIPEFGTTINVFRFDLNTQSRCHAFDLQWRGGRFIKV